MMTVTEAELMKQAAEKARSASFSVPAPQQLFRLQDLETATASGGANASQSQQELCSPDREDVQHQQGMPSTGRTHHNTLLQDADSCNNSGNSSPKSTRLKAAQQSRRSQSCRIPGSKNASRPHVRRRLVQQQGEEDSANSSSANIENCQDLDDPSQIQQQQSTEGDSYNSFLRKVPSCGRLLALTPEDCMYVQDDAEDSPVPLRRSASARRPTKHGLYTDSPVDHSPTPPRHPRQQNRARASGSTRRPAAGASRKGGGLLEVRDPNEGGQDSLDTDQYLLRNFSTTHKGGVINRGDSFRRRRSRSNSVQPPTDLPLLPQPSVTATSPSAAHTFSPADIPSTSAAQTPENDNQASGYLHAGSYRVPILGSTGVGKTALIHQFRTSECINAYDCPAPGDEEESTVSIVLNNYESDIIFVNVTSADEFQQESERDVSGWVIVYSITDKTSFQKATEKLVKLQSLSLLRGRAVIIVANKCELVRSRAVGVDDGRDLAISYGAKFMEISVGMNHKCDDLLVGIMHQLRLREEERGSDKAEKTPWTRNRSLMRASMKAKRLMHRVMGRSDSKYKSCEDFSS